ncbi:hypothetical protein GCM10010393_31520 [Streptomyces gobitricini]|uniref:Uncharacterized protein n=1 Tax=Streptomyces gobitricini TaxID=68211 RepID=A0ABN3MBC9_9ACTN
MAGHLGVAAPDDVYESGALHRGCRAPVGRAGAQDAQRPGNDPQVPARRRAREAYHCPCRLGLLLSPRGRPGASVAAPVL